MRYIGLNALALVSITMLTACAVTPTTAPTNVVPCLALDPITYDDNEDSAETVRQVREFNAVYVELCR